MQVTNLRGKEDQTLFPLFFCHSKFKYTLLGLGINSYVEIEFILKHIFLTRSKFLALRALEQFLPLGIINMVFLLLSDTTRVIRHQFLWIFGYLS